MTDVAAPRTPHDELLRHGFRSTGSDSNGDQHYRQFINRGLGRNTHDITVHHRIGEDGSPVPTGASYQMYDTNGLPYAGGMYNRGPRRVHDPVRDIINHHRGVLGAINTEPASYGGWDVNRENVHNLLPQSQHMEPLDEEGMAWEVAPDHDQYSIGQRGVGPRVNSSKVPPLDDSVNEALTGAGFTHMGRFLNDPGTDNYYVEYQDPKNPHTMRLSFRVRYRPESDEPFSYSGNRHQSGYDDSGNIDHGAPIDVSGGLDPVVKFATADDLLGQHNGLVDQFGIDPSSRTKLASFKASKRDRLIMERADRDLRP